MTKRRSTKNALISSVLALVLCFTMLLGTTYAWFTDSVTSATNIIAAGNLDIELYHTNSADKRENVSGDTKLFDDVTPSLWEPGAMAYEQFEVANEGTLALKYQFALNVANATVINGVSFAQMLKVAVVEEGFVYTRANVEAIAADKWQTLSTFTLSGNLEAEQNDVFGVVIWWQPNENDNLFNMSNENKGKTVSVEVGVSLKAAQLMSEDDSFSNSYDGGAEWLGNVDYSWYNTTDTEFVIYGAEQLAGLAAIVNGTAKDIAIDSFAGKTVKLGCDVNLNNLAWTPIGDVEADDFVGFQGTFDGQGYTISNLYISSNTWGQGLFGYMTTNATVTNFDVKNAYVKASDNCGIVVGYATKGTFSNINVTGDVTVIGTSADGHVGGIAGCGYNASFTDCSVIANAGSTITTDGPFAGGIVGYQCNNAKTIANCKVANLTITGNAAVGSVAGIVQTGTTFEKLVAENVVLNMIRTNGDPAIGALIGNYSGTAATVITGSVNNVTLNGAHVAYPAYNVLYGSNYSGATTPDFDVTGVTGVDTITNNLVEAILATPATVQDMINAAQAGETIVLGKGTYKDTIVMKSGITLLGARDAVVYCVNLNGADDITLKNINFDAAGAKMSYDGAGKAKQNANIISGDTAKKNSGSTNIVIDGCTFTGTFANGGAAIAFVDQNRKSGGSGNITIKNCTFNTANAYYDIYTHYAGDGLNGHGDFIIENNTFSSARQGKAIYLGRYASSTPVVIKGNTFNASSVEKAVYIQDHSNYGVSFDAADNTFNG